MTQVRWAAAILGFSLALLILRAFTGWTWGSILLVILAAINLFYAQDLKEKDENNDVLRKQNDTLRDSNDLLRQKEQVEGAYRSAWRMERIAKEMYRTKYENEKRRWRLF